jgi:hypothetical protein
MSLGTFTPKVCCLLLGASLFASLFSIIGIALTATLPIAKDDLLSYTIFKGFIKEAGTLYSYQLSSCKIDTNGEATKEKIVNLIERNEEICVKFNQRGIYVFVATIIAVTLNFIILCLSSLLPVLSFIAAFFGIAGIAGLVWFVVIVKNIINLSQNAFGKLYIIPLCFEVLATVLTFFYGFYHTLKVDNEHC